MSWLEPEDGQWDDPYGDGGEDPDGRRWPLTGAVYTRASAGCGSSGCGPTSCALRERYRLPVRSGWWEDEVQVEALAALAPGSHRYDSGEWDDPPGKLALLYDLERVAALLRDGMSRFTRP